MNATQSNEAGLGEVDQASAPNLRADEASVLRLYMDVTGETESQARVVFMFVSPGNPLNALRRP